MHALTFDFPLRNHGAWGYKTHPWNGSCLRVHPCFCALLRGGCEGQLCGVKIHVHAKTEAHELVSTGSFEKYFVVWDNSCTSKHAGAHLIFSLGEKMRGCCSGQRHSNNVPRNIPALVTVHKVSQAVRLHIYKFTKCLFGPYAHGNFWASIFCSDCKGISRSIAYNTRNETVQVALFVPCHRVCDSIVWSVTASIYKLFRVLEACERIRVDVRPHLCSFCTILKLQVLSSSPISWQRLIYSPQ